VLRVLWSAQQLKSAKGPDFLGQVGNKLRSFVVSQKGQSPQRGVDIAFTLGKRQFLAELEQVSRELGSSWDGDSRADQLFLELIKSGRYKMLRLNLKWLEQFFGCPRINPYLHASNAVSAECLAQHGARGLTSKNGNSITPDWFFYTWVGWMVNKKPSTVRRLIQSAETKFRARVASYEKTYKP
jgi:hypothetical protein